VPSVLSPSESQGSQSWPAWQRVGFRFFFVFFLLEIAPWSWFSAIPGIRWLVGLWYQGLNRAVTAANACCFHVRETLVPFNGSGDTSYGWAQLWFLLSAAAIAAVVWSLLDWKRPNYERGLYWLRTMVRFYLASAALSYGIIKLFATQMPFPALSQLATPLGDLLPMRLSWLFMGYSTPYQVFAGAMEFVAGMLLLFRPTVTAGLLLAMGSFLNVAMINLGYDVPVKIFSMKLFLSSVFLLALDYKRLLGFLVFNQGAPPTRAWEPRFTQPWQRWAALAVWLFMVWQLLVEPFRDSIRYTRLLATRSAPGVFGTAVYDVKHFVVGADTIPAAGPDSLRWKDVIFDNAGGGSVATRDSLFWRRYGRGYFRYKPDTTAKTVAVWRTSWVPGDSVFLFTMRYERPDTSTIRFHTAIRGDSVHMELVRLERHFQLAERQFHWLSEYNR
jgi:hypothetical protein